MSSDARTARWQRLADASIVKGPLPDDAAHRGPWYISAMVGAAAWLAALFLMFFLGLGLSDIVSGAAGSIGTGVVVCAIAVAVLRRAADRLFVGQLALAFSLAGQGLVLFGLVFDRLRPETWEWLVFAAFEALLVAVVAHGGHRVLATLGCAMALMMALASLWASALFLPIVVGAFVFAQAQVLAGAKRHALWQAVAVGLALAIVAAMVHAAVPDFWTSRPRVPAWLPVALRWAGVITLAGVAAVAGVVLTRDAEPNASARSLALAGGALAAVSLAAYAVPAVAAALVILLMAFAAGQRALVGIAVIALVVALSYHYYRLDATLMQKAAALGAMGIVLLLARFAASRLLPPGEARHA